VGDRRLAGTGEAGEEDREALLTTRRVGAAQLGGHLAGGEPVRYLPALCKAASELGARNRQHTSSSGNLLLWQVGPLVLQVEHLSERQDLHAELRAVAVKELLRVVQRVERTTTRVAAGAGMVSADDEVCGAVVSSD